MYQTLLAFHSIFRWLVLISLLWSIFAAFVGLRQKLTFTQKHNLLRHWTATNAHIQLMIGIVLYSQSPMVKFYFSDHAGMEGIGQPLFFAVIHIALMLLSIVLITIGSALAKRKIQDREKFQTMLIWFSVALFIIFLAIPWPFSPLAQRPYLTTF